MESSPLPLPTMLPEPSPWIAIGISTLSLLVSSLVFLRERTVLQVTSTYEEGWEAFTARIRINAVNRGRKQIIRHSWGGAATKGRFIRRVDGIKWMTQQFAGIEGHTLTEQKPYQLVLEASDLEYELQDGTDFMMDDIWIDTVGRRHNIKGSREDAPSCGHGLRNSRHRFRQANSRCGAGKEIGA